MQVSNDILLNSSAYTQTNSQLSSDNELNSSSFADELNKYKTRDEINDEDTALQQFKEDLTTKGAVKFLQDFNMEKIEKMIEKYKQELLKNLGEDATPAQLAEVEKLVEDYRKTLLEQLSEINDKDKDSPFGKTSKLEDALALLS